MQARVLSVQENDELLLQSATACGIATVICQPPPLRLSAADFCGIPDDYDPLNLTEPEAARTTIDTPEQLVQMDTVDHGHALAGVRAILHDVLAYLTPAAFEQTGASNQNLPSLPTVEGWSLYTERHNELQHLLIEDGQILLEDIFWAAYQCALASEQTSVIKQRKRDS
ncbi:hypothetical protein B0T45_21015 [Chromobacterium haemolyticum]|uniref:Type VI secretion system FHA domain-containing protein n=1 Tax=Chromobacterium haemolyticum TaxID=394935 RepID=A0A1W0CDY4_9NEIS|nr:hypothetical protein B0T45_21015 [Chromobacterium haemolyticum]